MNQNQNMVKIEGGVAISAKNSIKIFKCNLIKFEIWGKNDQVLCPVSGNI